LSHADHRRPSCPGSPAKAAADIKMNSRSRERI
jgi:hypothetical protein